jgi:MFS transporter, DHA1 family, tetracycline resistance protein
MIKTLVLVTALCNVSFMVFNTVIGPMARVIGMPEWQIGVMVSMSGLAWMLSSRPWGLAGDRKGHWPMMRLGLIGFVIGFIALCLVSILGIERLIGPTLLFVLLLILRIWLGVVFAVVPVAAQSMIAAKFSIADRPAAMAALGAASGIGMVLGPAIGGGLGAISLWLPLIMSVFLVIGAYVYTTRVGPELAAISAEQMASNSKEQHVALSLRDPRIRWPMIVAFFTMFSVMSAQINTAFYLIDRLHISAEASTGYTGIALTSVGVAIILAQLTVRFLNKRGIKLTPNQMIAFGTGLGGLGFFSCTLFDSITLISVCYFFCGFGMGFVFPAFGAQASISVQSHEVGAAAGTVGAAQAAGMVVGPFLATLVFKLNPALPYWCIAFILCSICAVALTKVLSVKY